MYRRRGGRRSLEATELNIKALKNKKVVKVAEKQNKAEF